MARGSRMEVPIDAMVTAVDSDGEYELTAETFVMHSGLGITWNPAQITRPWSKLTVAGRLVQVPVAPEELRVPAPSRRFARNCCDASGHGARRCQP